MTSHSASKETRIETDGFVLCISLSGTTLGLRMAPRADAEDAPTAKTEALLARLVRAACPVLRPDAIRWRDHDRALEIDTWLSAFRPIRPRRVRPRPTSTTARPEIDISVWPDRPTDLQRRDLTEPFSGSGLREDAMAKRFTQWDVDSTAAQPENRFEREPALQRLSSWIMTGTTAALCPPAGASIAVLNLTKRTNLRLNLHALTLTLVIVSLQQSGALRLLAP